MAASSAKKITSLPNFRVVCEGLLYRSSRPEHLSKEDLITLSKDLGVKTIIDLRSVNDAGFPRHEKSQGNLLDSFYKPYDGTQKQTQGQIVATELKVYKDKSKGNPSENPETDVDSALRKHYVVDLVALNYGMAIMNRVPLTQKLLVGVKYVKDMIVGSRDSHELVIRYGMNPFGIAQQYIDFLEYCKERVCTVLRLLSSADTLPALVCCTHGKDRTGLITFLCHTLMQKQKDFIISDYAMTETELKVIWPSVEDDFKSRKLEEEFMYSKPQTMEAVIKHIEEKYGTVEKYLESTGFTLEDQQKLIKNLSTKCELQ